MPDLLFFIYLCLLLSLERNGRNFLGSPVSNVYTSVLVTHSDLSLDAGRECSAQEVSSELPILLVFLS